MGLLDDIQKEPRAKSGRACTVKAVATMMNKKDRDDFMQAIDDELVPSTVIARVLKRRSIEIQPASIQRHRRNDCTCD